LGRASGIAWRVSRIRGNTARVKISWTTDPRRSKDKTSAPWYGHFLEFGTRFISARPFLRPAFFSKQGEALEVFRRKLGEGIDKQLSRLR
jgi:HK97 gp10 family phage protein